MAKIYRTTKGKVEVIPAREIKQTIMRANNWTEDQYRKQYDLFKNKLRAYESFRKAHGAKVETQSPQELLYRQAKAKERYGEDYTPSREMQRIASFSAVSITKGRRLAQDFESTYSKRRAAEYEETTKAQFGGFIEETPKAQEIITKISDPVLREEALKDLAEYVHAKQAPDGEIMRGETYGSDEAADDFSVEAWLDDNEDTEGE